jgi:AAA+ ATPase superfamily predicted ATPase
MSRHEWGFYGRRQEMAQLSEVLGRGRWFFVKLSGRRRIGKSTLVQQALQPAQRDRVLYARFQTPTLLGS